MTPVVVLLDRAPSTGPQPARQLEVASQAVDGCRNGARIAWIDTQAAFTGVDDGALARKVGGDHGNPRRHVFEHLDRQRIAIAVRWQQRDQAGAGALHDARNTGPVEVT